MAFTRITALAPLRIVWMVQIALFLCVTFQLPAAPCQATYQVILSAVGNGIADDADRIQALIDGSCANSTIDFGPAYKTYLLSHQLVLKPNRTYSGAATLKMRNPAARSYRGYPVESIFKTTFGQSSGITIAGLTLDGNGIASGMVLNVDGGSTLGIQNFTLRDCIVKNGMLKAPWVPALYAINLQNSRILNNRFQNQPQGLVIYNHQQVLIQGNDFDNVTQSNAISAIQVTPAGRDLQIRNNTGRNLSRMAIEVFGGAPGAMIDGVVVDSNNFTDWRANGNFDAYGISLVVGKNATVTRNTLSRGLYGYGIEAGVDGLVVDGNTITGFPLGIAVQGKSDVIVRNNRLVAQTDSGIWFSNSAQGINRRTMVLNNVIENSLQAAISSVPNDPGGSVISGNTITRSGGFFPQDSAQSFPFFGIKVDGGQTLPITIQNNTITQTATTPPANFQFWGFGLFSHLAAGGNVFDGNTIQSLSGRPLGNGFNLWGGGLLDRDIVRNTKWVNLERVVNGGTTSLISIANNLTCGVTSSDPLLATGVDPQCVFGATRKTTAPSVASAAAYPSEMSETSPLVEVIVQFKAAPGEPEHALVTRYGGVLRQALPLVRGAHYSMPASALAALAEDSRVAFIHPDQPLTTSLLLPGDGPGNLAAILPSDGAGIGIGVIDDGPPTADLRAMAPGAELISLPAHTDSTAIQAISQAIGLRNIGNLRVLYLALGRPVTGSYQRDPLCQAVEAAWQAGLVVVVAAGNDDAAGAIQSPANDPYVITAGIANESAQGPSPIDHIVKPDLFASADFDPRGTGHSAAALTAAVARLLQQRPSLTPDEVKATLLLTATRFRPDGAGALNLPAALGRPATLPAGASALSTTALPDGPAGSRLPGGAH